jgi:hypothetical protein
MIYLHPEFYMSCSNGSLVVTMKPKLKYIFHASTMLSFYTLQKNWINKDNVFFKVLLPHKFQDPTLSGTNVASTLEVHMSTILVLLMAGNEVQRWSGLA